MQRSERRAKFVALCVAAALQGCDRPVDNDAQAAEVNARLALSKVTDLQEQVDRLEREVRDDRRSADLQAGSLTESRENHTRLLNTFNSNVEKSNKRDTAQEADIDWLMRRAGVAR